MSLIVVPNVSTGSDEVVLRSLEARMRSAGAIGLDTHSDAVHDRSVFTVSGTTEVLIKAMAELADEARRLDLTAQRGVHPRLGVLDVCPFVPYGDTTMEVAIGASRSAGALIAERAGLPVYLYGEAATSPETKSLPGLRKGGLDELRRRAARGLLPDYGPADIDARLGVVCVGAREVLIAFNVWLRCLPRTARLIAERVRESSGGLAGVRALAFLIHPPTTCQVSMNLTAPELTGIQEAFEAVDAGAEAMGASVLATELVGLVPERFLPRDAKATRLLKEPGRSLESAIKEAGL